MRKILITGLILLFSATLIAQSRDTLKPRILTQWNLSTDFTEEVIIPFDTVFSLFHRYRHADGLPVNATLGIMPAFYQISFFDRVTDPDKFLITNYYLLFIS
jgi:hypothetical protein